MRNQVENLKMFPEEFKRLEDKIQKEQYEMKKLLRKN
jgi:hypothetical protein